MKRKHLNSEDLVRIAQEVKTIRSRLNIIEDIILQSQLNEKIERDFTDELD